MKTADGRGAVRRAAVRARAGDRDADERRRDRRRQLRCTAISRSTSSVSSIAETVALMGFSRDGWRLDDTVHPFATGSARGDVRITTRWDESYFAAALYGAMHECGHGLYEAGIAAIACSARRSAHGESLGMHESQSRLWENMVGRGRPFCGVLAPLVGEHLGGSLDGLDADTLYRAVNRIKPSYIRVESDEVTYGAAHRAAVRARAAADRRQRWRSRISPRRGTLASTSTSGSRSPTTPTACSRTSTGRPA